MPPILESGTEADEIKIIINRQEMNIMDKINVNKILGFSILPSLVTNFCLSESYEI